ncbi:MAG: universal stress protein [Dehalococcoidia bacterium]|jgi:nucleotide-binding universal stress UspA family protein
MEIDKILVAARGNGVDQVAVELACKLGKKSKAKIYIVYVIEVNRSLPVDAIIKPDMELAEKVLLEAEEYAQDNDFEVDTEIIQAREVGPAIIEVARQNSVDMIIMGITYKKRFGSFTMGNAVPHVLEEAPCRVLICREPKQ